MEPFSSLGLACNILQLFELSWKLYTGARSVYTALDGTTANTETLDAVASNVADLSKSIAASYARANLPPRLQRLCQLSQAVAADLSAVLTTFKADHPPKKWQSFVIALREIRSKSQVKELTDRIQQLQSQIMADLQFLMMDTQSEVFQEISSLQHITEDLGVSLKTHVDDMRDSVVEQLSQINKLDIEKAMGQVAKDFQKLAVEPPSNVNHLREISRKLDDLSISITNLHHGMVATQSDLNVLKTIRFERLSHRYERIPASYQKTFEWAFQDEAPGRYGNTTLHFRDWLQNKEGLFWIRGKAGSGKSTLMKFLCNAPRTMELLGSWAGQDHRLVIAKYFFWNPGATLQKSQEGLVRSLLFDILRQCPERIPAVKTELSRRQAELETSHSEELWTWQFLIETFRKVVEDTTTTAKICFFIDGLDEYEGASGSLIDTVREIASFSNTKVCVSSRPWAEFVLEFGDDSNNLLKVEDLTAQDISAYTSGTLLANRRFERLASRDDTMHQLIDEVVQTSHGVFLWVHLVVRSLLEGMRYADSIQFLWKRLRCFPPDLDSFFYHMLQGVPTIYRSKAITSFMVAMTAIEPLPAITYYFIERAAEEPDFALTCPWTGMTQTEVEENIQDTTLRLDGWTKGLLEVVHHSYNQPHYHKSTVDFLHRTVRDFIQESEKVRQMFISVSQTEVATLICHGSLAFLKNNPVLEPEYLDYQLVASIFYHASLASVDPDRSRSKLLFPVLDQLGYALQMRETPDWKHTDWKLEKGGAAIQMCEYAAQFGLKDYLLEILRGLDTANLYGNLENFHTDMLQVAFREERNVITWTYPRSWELIRGLTLYLLEQGADPNAGDIWSTFIESYGVTMASQNPAVLDICHAMMSSGADVDHPSLKGRGDYHALLQHIATCYPGGGKIKESM